MLKPGMIIGDRYEIIDKVGSGGMADVYKAKDQRLNRFVAIKVLKPEYSSDKSFVNKFRGEAQSAAGLSHPNIVNVYDVGDDGGLHFIVMELVEGITLKRFIERKGKLEIKEAVGIGIQIAQGMEAAHDNHIIHRDIKPQNIIISRDGKVKVTDFGIAKATNSNTITSNAMGSVHYLSPEQARGGYSDEKSDIYSLGVTLYEMLSGKVPFAGDNTVSVALLHIQGEAMPLRELDPEIPVSIDKIVQKCMQKKPERRYHSASELIADLKRAISNPDGDFVQIPAFTASDSPTINISDDLSRIKSGTYADEDLRPTKNLQPSRLAEDDDEDLETVDSKVEKVFMIGTIITAVVLAVVIFVIVGWFLSRGNKKEEPGNPEVTVSVAPTLSPTLTPGEALTEETYNVPKVLGLTSEDAEKMIKGFDPDAFVDSRKEDYSDEYEAGEVMKQYPDADSPYKKGSTVILTISLGAEPLEVPNIYGQTEANARLKLEEKGLKIEPEYVFNDKIEKGQVIETDPIRGTTVKSGDTIKVMISNGPENQPAAQVEVPYIINMTLDEAQAALAAIGLSIGEVGYDASKDYEKDHITYQSTSQGVKVDPGTKINITISSGPEPTGYYGRLAIDDINPFDYLDIEDDEGVDVKLVLEQDGHKGEIFSGTMIASDFPYYSEPEDIPSDSQTDGIVTMYINGKKFTLPGETQPYTWTVTFEPEGN